MEPTLEPSRRHAPDFAYMLVGLASATFVAFNVPAIGQSLGWTNGSLTPSGAALELAEACAATGILLAMFVGRRTPGRWAWGMASVIPFLSCRTPWNYSIGGIEIHVLALSLLQVGFIHAGVWTVDRLADKLLPRATAGAETKKQRGKNKQRLSQAG